MIRPRLSRQLAIYLFLSLCVILQGCAGMTKGRSSMKIGMHIDAVLEFIVEYPQAWSKDRRLSYGSKEGEVRWTHPDQPHTLLKVKSYFQKQPALSPEQQIDLLLREYVGLKESTREKVTLPAGDAWHITGHMAEIVIDIHTLSLAERSYEIIFTSPQNSIDNFEEVMERVTHSFLAMPSSLSDKQ